MANEKQDPAYPYRAEGIPVLRGLEHVRRRPGMYLGGDSPLGLHRLLFQLVGHSLAEAAAGHSRSLRVTLNPDGSVEVQDDGRGIDPALGKPLLEAVLTDLFTPGSAPPGRDWRDYEIANALSEWFHVETRHEGRVCRQEFRRGEPVAAPRPTGVCSDPGVRVTFKPDPAIFPDPQLSYAAVRAGPGIDRQAGEFVRGVQGSPLGSRPLPLAGRPVGVPFGHRDRRPASLVGHPGPDTAAARTGE